MEGIGEAVWIEDQLEGGRFRWSDARFRFCSHTF